jgi:hypothetical protein
MKSFLAWLLGMKTFPDGAVEKFRFSLLHVPEGLEAVVTFLFAACVLGFAWWIYLKRRQVLGRRRWVLMALRIAALSLVFFLLLGPYVEIVCQDTTKSTVAVLIDNSMSMTIADKRPTPESMKHTAQALGLDPAGPPEVQKRIREATRMEIMKAALGNQEKGLIRELEGRFALKLYSFGREVLPGPGRHWMNSGVSRSPAWWSFPTDPPTAAPIRAMPSPRRANAMCRSISSAWGNRMRRTCRFPLSPCAMSCSGMTRRR